MPSHSKAACRALVLALALASAGAAAHPTITAAQLAAPTPTQDAAGADTAALRGGPWSSPFTPLGLSTPNAYRSGDGRPGPAYWQQRANYTIEATLDPESNTLSGHQTIRYRNASPDTLRFVWLQLDQNRFRQGSRGEVVTPIGGRFEGRGEPGGIDVTSFRAAGSGAELPRIARDTRLRVELDQPLPPGGEATWELAWRFPIPRYGADRMGREDLSQGTVYEIAQWYPRMAVYDDVKGWNTEPYLGIGEFYLEFGQFDVKLTVPRDFIVAATGTLQNAADVLTAEQLGRLDRAKTSEETVTILGPDDVGSPGSRPSGSGPLTWHFRAENVRDFAWSASPAFVWDAASWDGVLAQSVYPKEALPLWRESTQMVRESLRLQSRWFRYPYPSMTNVNGIAGGMEYPMIVFCGERENERDLWAVTNHEIGHTWFPMVVASNERLHMWFDEGLNTYINGFATSVRYDEPLTGRGTSVELLPYLLGDDQALMTRADAQEFAGLGQLAYNKPAVGLRLLREVVIGDTLLFDRAFEGYIDTWAYKHPTPDDFFRYMSSQLGENLDWFWRGWFLTNDKLDLAVDGVEVSAAPNGQVLSTVRVASRGDMVFPVPLLLELEGGETRRQTLPVEVWLRGSKFDYPVVAPKPVVGVRIDPEETLPDLVPANDGWGSLGPAAAGGAVTPKPSAPEQEPEDPQDPQPPQAPEAPPAPLQPPREQPAPAGQAS